MMPLVAKRIWWALLDITSVLELTLAIYPLIEEPTEIDGCEGSRGRTKPLVPSLIAYSYPSLPHWSTDDTSSTMLVELSIDVPCLQCLFRAPRTRSKSKEQQGACQPITSLLLWQNNLAASQGSEATLYRLLTAGIARLAGCTSTYPWLPPFLISNS